MREIKFRAWDGVKVRYDITGFEHGDKNEMAGVFIDGDYYKMTIDSSSHPYAEVMQYTGLKDKNGREIYEGDIISGKNSPFGPAIHTVSWDNYSASFCCFLHPITKYDTSMRITQSWIDEFEKVIIGNIHEGTK